MYRSDKLSVVFENGSETHRRTLDEVPLPRGDDTENVTRVALSIKPRTPLQVTLVLHEGFDLFDAEGLRVTIAIGRRYYSPDDVQSWWVPRKDLTDAIETETVWSQFWTWSSSNIRGTPHILLMSRPDAQFKSTPCAEWASIMNAAPGCIAVYVTRGFLPREPTRGLKRCSTDPPESQRFHESTHPIRAEWFRPLSNEAGKAYIFEAANVDEKSLKAMARSQRSSDKSGGDNQDAVADRNALDGAKTRATGDARLSRSAARNVAQARGLKLTQLQREPEPLSNRPSRQAPEANMAGLKRPLATSRTEDSNSSKKVKTEPSADIEQAPLPEDVQPRSWRTLGDGDDDLLILDNVASSPGIIDSGAQGGLSKGQQHAERLSKMRIELQEAEVKMLKDKIEHEVKFGAGFKE